MSTPVRNDPGVARRSARARSGVGYHAGLDGLRALAVGAVIAYHAGIPGARGGFLGVEVFFVLSGFLITSLLVREWLATSRNELTAFWSRRARRLLPALFCVVTVVGIYYAAAGPGRAVPGLKQDGIATLLYVGNWHQIASGSGYFAANGPVSPLEHTWSLAIEEQFYIVWPVLLTGILWVAARRDRRDRGSGAAAAPRRALRALLAVSLLGAAASALDSALQIRGGLGLNRVYYGTDTRAAGILIGASLASGLALGGERRAQPGALRAALTHGAAASVLAILALMTVAAGDSTWLYPFGFLGLDTAVVVLIAALVTRPESLVARAFSLRPLRAIGAISYGIYLWHFPLFLWLDTSSTGLCGGRARAGARHRDGPRQRRLLRADRAAGAPAVDPGVAPAAACTACRGRCGRHRLEDGDVLTFGSTSVVFRAPGPAFESTESAWPQPVPTRVTVSERCVLTALCRPPHERSSPSPATNREIAEELCLSIPAVKRRLGVLFERFELAELPHNEKRARLADAALRAGIVTAADF